MNMKRCLCILLTISLLLLSLCGCREEAPVVSQPETQPVSDVPETAAPGSIALPYNKEASLDPFVTDSRINLDLASLLYQSLVTLDSAWMPQEALAQSITADGTILTVTLREGALFSDGTAVTAADVVYSFGRAAKSAPYKALLAGITACRAEGSGTAVFSLRSADPHAGARLTFPIVKAPGKKAPAVPVGSGLYIYDAEAGALVSNPHAEGAASRGALQLYHIDNEDMLLHALESGHISYYFDTVSDGSLPRSVKASLSADMLYLVFLGINGYAVSQPSVRQALSAMVDRSALVQDAFEKYARAAVTPFHPLWGSTNGLYTFSAVAAVNNARDLLESAGYRSYADSKKKKTLTLELIYVSDNPMKKAAAEQLVSQAAAVGITLKLLALDYNAYIARLQSGSYQLYLGEVRLPYASDLSALFSGQASYGVRGDSAAAAAYVQYSSGIGSLDAFLEAFAAEMPFVPLCYRKGQALFNRSLGALAPLAGQVYYRPDQWTVS